MSWVTTAWSVGQAESALRDTILFVTLCMTQLLLQASLHRRRVALFCLEMIGGQPTFFSLGGLEVETPPLM